MALFIGGLASGQEATDEERPYPDRKPMSAAKKFQSKPADLRRRPNYKAVPGDETWVCFGEEKNVVVLSESITDMKKVSIALIDVEEEEDEVKERARNILEQLAEEEKIHYSTTFARVKVLDVRWPTDTPSFGTPIARVRFLTGPNKGKYAWTIVEMLNFPEDIPSAVEETPSKK